ncbi:hypothetical protein FPQ18DRAFT_308091 [Pyronema domesticum]|uniref:Similar to Uncharacterized protein YGR111W acc. no. P53265 n=1 Tax=Pyronema omphalodes (strain CBS 100304) TaxID=1076935 RepID=U4LCD6_PYROM|nr:hypothetical protein FPQ18DRAFT_308091 [Pyronema domesticum]CCX29754.1 Similar to Uncharacterized protein YGR111W; acc. no. P53265 [Pyronema omphalodes CBS 100304]
MTDSHLILRLATPTESRYIRDQNAASWAGDLPVETYHKREHVLASTALTRDGGIECWVLIDPSKPSEVLTSCETIKKPAYLSRPPDNGDKICNVVEVYAHGLGSVYTPECQRKKGYCQEMLRLIKEHMMKENPEGFNVLYSDIGKQFYAKHGWLPHRSSHLQFPSVGPVPESTMTGITPLVRASIPALCAQDIALVKSHLLTPPSHKKSRIAFIPDYNTMDWHWTREEFIAPVLRAHMNEAPEIKGAITKDGKRWVLWNRDFATKSSQLYIIRYVDLSKQPRESRESSALSQSPRSSLSSGSESSNSDNSDSESEQEDQEEQEQLSALLTAAAMEAKKWGLAKVTMWNPDKACVKAAQKAFGNEVKMVDREMDSIASVMMHKEGSDEESIEWVANEKYAWC